MYTRARRHHFDVAIIGTGLGSTILALILARQGLDVILIERGSHPRFAIGESSIPETSLYLRILALRYNTPELFNIASFNSINSSINHNFGIKVNFGFVFNKKGSQYRTGDGFQLSAITGEYAETHLFRQDIDAWMLQNAIHNGCCVYQNTLVKGVDISEDEIRVHLEGHPDVTGRYLVDASGHNSLISKMYQLHNPEPLETCSRSIFTHMIDVRYFDDVLPSAESDQCSPWAKGTLHHLFDDGWMWVIPFNNHSDASNRLCSVGLMLDGHKHTELIHDPETFFCQWVEQYPDLKKQFETARAIREWVSTPPIQYSATQSAGKRWCLLSHAYGFVDPLFSRGLFNTVSVVNQLAVRLMIAFKNNDFSESGFSNLNQWQQQTLIWNDRLVAGAYWSFGHPELWKWWFRVWALTSTWGGIHLLQAYQLLEKDPGSIEACRLLDNPSFPGALAPGNKAVNELLASAFKVMKLFRLRKISLKQTEAGLKALFISVGDLLPPNFDYLDEHARFGYLDKTHSAQMEQWIQKYADRSGQ